jgi:probable lipoprotein NlpC
MYAMETKIKIMSVLLAFMLAFGTSCHVTMPVNVDGPYKMYSQKLGVKLQGNEDLSLLESMLAWKGTPYRYGGNTKTGTDCSGFVSSIYKEVYGTKLERSSKDMIHDVKIVSKKDLKTGDILFFKLRGKGISHVGIYIADNKFIHAETRKGIVVTDLDKGYYAKGFYKAGRVKR